MRTNQIQLQIIGCKRERNKFWNKLIKVRHTCNVCYTLVSNSDNPQSIFRVIHAMHSKQNPISQKKKFKFQIPEFWKPLSHTQTDHPKNSLV